MKAEDANIGQKYKSWTIIEDRGKNKNGKQQYLCECDCGDEHRIFDIYSLNSGVMSKCKNVKRKDTSVEMIGLVFGKLTVISRSDYRGKNDKEIYYSCKCECDSIRDYLGTSLRRNKGATKSCGCIPKNKTHGLHNTKIYKTLDGMRYRCFNANAPNFHNYGGRGITICNEWLGKNGIIEFYNWAVDNGYDEELTIDRIDNNGNYEPDNCRWVDMKVQGNNKRTNIYHEMYGMVKTISEWSDYSGIYYSTLLKRLENGMSIGEAIDIKIKESITVTIDGEEKSFTEWEEISGIKSSKIRRRYNKGIRGEKLLSPNRIGRDCN